MKKIVLGKRVLAEPVKVSKNEDKGIIIPETVKDNEPVNTFRVVALGDEITKLQIDDLVHILARGGQLYKIDGKPVISEDQVVMVERK